MYQRSNNTCHGKQEDGMFVLLYDKSVYPRTVTLLSQGSIAKACSIVLLMNDERLNMGNAFKRRVLLKLSILRVCSASN